MFTVKCRFPVFLKPCKHGTVLHVVSVKDRVVRCQGNTAAICKDTAVYLFLHHKVVGQVILVVFMLYHRIINFGSWDGQPEFIPRILQDQFLLIYGRGRIRNGW